MALADRDKQVIGEVSGMTEGEQLYLIYSSKNSKILIVVKIYKMWNSSGFFKEAGWDGVYVKKLNGDVSWYCGIVMI